MSITFCNSLLDGYFLIDKYIKLLYNKTMLEKYKYVKELFETLASMERLDYQNILNDYNILLNKYGKFVARKYIILVYEELKKGLKK